MAVRPKTSTDTETGEPDNLDHDGNERPEDCERHQQPGQGLPGDVHDEKSIGKTCQTRIAAASLLTAAGW